MRIPRPRPVVEAVPNGRRRSDRSLALASILVAAAAFNAAEGARAATYTLRPAADTVVEQTQPNNNFGSLSSLTVRNGATARSEHAFLRFDIPSLAGSVTSATLSLRVTGAIQEVGTYAMAMGTPSWSESSLTWNNWSAGSSFTFLGSRTNLPVGSTHSMDVTGWITASSPVTFGLASGFDGTGQSFSSKEGAVVPTLTIVTTGDLGVCTTPSAILGELDSIVKTGNLLYGCDYKPKLSPTFGAWMGGSENLPVIAAAVALFDGPVVNGTDYRDWWATFFAGQATPPSSPAVGHLFHFKGSELFSNVYDAATVAGVLTARYWAQLHMDMGILDEAAAYLRRNFFAWALATSSVPFDEVYRVQGATRTFVTGPEGQCPTLAMASPRSKMYFGQDSKRWLLAKILGYSQTCYKMPGLKPLIDHVVSQYPGVSGLSASEKTALQQLIDSTTIPSNLGSVLGAVRMERDFHFLLWNDGRRATYYLGGQLNNNINTIGGKHTVFAALFTPATRDLDLLFAEGKNNESCADDGGNRIVVDDLSASGCSSTNWIPMPLGPPNHHFALGPSGWRSCSSLSC